MSNDVTNNAAPEMSELELAIKEAEAQGELERYEPQFEPLAVMSCRSIAEMSDEQLESYIGRYTQLVHDAEQNLESRRAKLGAGRLEKAERAITRRSKRIPKPDLSQAVDRLAAMSGPKPVKPVSSVEAWMKAKDSLKS